MALTLYTVEEAEDLLPDLVPELEELQKLHQELEFARGQGRDLERMWGEEVHDPDCGDHDDYVGYTEQAAEASARIHDVLQTFHERGVEVKDVATGLIDFHTRRDSGEVVYLCWRLGEEGGIQAWHPLFAGFRGRRPVDEL